MLMIEAVAACLRDIRHSPATDKAGHEDFEDAEALLSLMKRRGFALVPIKPDEALLREAWPAYTSEGDREAALGDFRDMVGACLDRARDGAPSTAAATA